MEGSGDEGSMAANDAAEPLVPRAAAAPEAAPEAPAPAPAPAAAATAAATAAADAGGDVQERLQQEIHIHVVKPEGAAFGARCRPDSRGEGCAIIASVSEAGLLADWNRLNPSKRVRSGDKIVAVNNVRGNFWPMMFELQGSGTHHIIVMPGSPADLIPVAPARRSGPPTASREFVNDLPRATANEYGSTECSICLEDLDPDTLVVQLPCNHTFHPDCAERWLTRCKAMCPLCNSAVGVPERTSSATAGTSGASSNFVASAVAATGALRPDETASDYAALSETDADGSADGETRRCIQRLRGCCRTPCCYPCPRCHCANAGGIIRHGCMRTRTTMASWMRAFQLWRHGAPEPMVELMGSFASAPDG
eukprot:TRINITY_DN5436_c0_g1_i1.p1 TRINITY_DN5436_c0_g1~~TRINITY_DN5436_c0_g1_i1.p1  ORF type:complete len:366 (-),score=44.60 TRINITY_DN5436_c0_g1_i1:249-1346(-)